MTVQAWERLVVADDRLPLGALAVTTDCSHRTLIERFLAWVGLPPVARLLRSLECYARSTGIAAGAASPLLARPISKWSSQGLVARGGQQRRP